MNCLQYLQLLLVFISLEPQGTLLGTPEMRVTHFRTKGQRLFNLECINKDSRSDEVEYEIRKWNADECQEDYLFNMKIFCGNNSVTSSEYLNDYTKQASCNSLKIFDIKPSHRLSRDLCCNVKINKSSKPFKSNFIHIKAPDGFNGFNLTRITPGSFPGTSEILTGPGNMAGGVTVSVKCETNGRETPAPDITILLNGVQLKHVEGKRYLEAFILVPKTPNVITFRCEASNGFSRGPLGWDLNVNALYKASHSQLVFPKDFTFNTTKEIEICSVPNNPPERLVVTGLAGLLMKGYPRSEERDGHSRVFVKLNENARSVKALKFTCGLQGHADPVEVSVPMAEWSYQNRSKRTIGIVIAVVIVFIIIIAVIALALWMRSQAKFLYPCSTLRKSDATRDSDSALAESGTLSDSAAAKPSTQPSRRGKAKRTSAVKSSTKAPKGTGGGKGRVNRR